LPPRLRTFRGAAAEYFLLRASEDPGPVVAALFPGSAAAMSVSCVSVIANALRLRRVTL
jgi:hypothetical protein